MQQENNTLAENVQEENVEKLKQWLEHYVRLYKLASNRKIRCEMLMRRYGSKKWSQEKTAKMVRRLMVSSKEVKAATDALDQIQAKLSEVGIEVDIVSKKSITT
jgi:hypothetical protein